MRFEEAWAKAYQIEGWLFREEAELLYRLCDGPWCEVGCWKGRSTSILAATGYEGWAVDHFKGSSEHPEGTDTFWEYIHNISGFQNVTTLVSNFRWASHRLPGGFSLLHLDAEHTYEATKEAFDLFSPLVSVDGRVVFHDAWGEDGPGSKYQPWPGTMEFIMAEMIFNENWEHEEDVRRCASFRRVT